MQPAKNRWLTFWLIAALIAVINLIIFDAIIVSSPDTVQVAYTPDDAYYYLSLARNFVHYHEWTFDSGVSKTSGFHPMLAYVLSLLYAIFRPGTDSFVRIGLIVSITFTLLSTFFLLWQGWQRKEAFFLAALAIILSVRNILLNSVSGVEWPLVVFVIALFCVTVARNCSSRAGKMTLFVLGALGSLTRSDFGILTFAFLCAALILWRGNKNKDFLRAAGSGVAGAVVGVGLLFLHNYVLTGLAVQSSALMKSQWTSREAAISILRNGLAGLILVMVLPLLFGFLNRKKVRAVLSGLSEVQKLFGLAALFDWIGYALFYSRASDVQPWYSANILMPAFVFLAALWYSIEHGILKELKLAPQIIFIVLFAIFFIRTLLITYPINAANGEWPHQQAMLDAGKYLREHPLDGHIGGWNVGIVNYYQGGEVINLDGVVNNDIYPYATTNTTPLYMQKENIQYIIDFDNMFRELAVERGGYDDPQFLSSLQPLMRFDEGQYPTWVHLTLYKIGK